jgi:hypothetical protein
MMVPEGDPEFLISKARPARARVSAELRIELHLQLLGSQYPPRFAPVD